MYIKINDLKIYSYFNKENYINDVFVDVMKIHPTPSYEDTLKLDIAAKVFMNR